MEVNAKSSTKVTRQTIAAQWYHFAAHWPTPFSPIVQLKNILVIDNHGLLYSHVMVGHGCLGLSVVDGQPTIGLSMDTDGMQRAALQGCV